MDITEIKDLIAWIIGLSATSVVALVVGVISIVRAGKLLPREVRGVDLDNRMKEADLALKMEGAADRALAKSQTMQMRLDTIEIKYDTLEDRVREQDKIIAAQTKIIEEQVSRLSAQEVCACVEELSHEERLLVY